MRYLILLKGDPPATPPPAELMEAIMELGDEATAAGALLDTAGLAPSAAGARVGAGRRKLSVTDGPFAEAKETHQLRPVRGALQGGGGRVGRAGS